MAVNVGTAYVELVPSAQGFVNKVRNELGGLDNEGSKAGEAAGAGFASRFGGHMKTVGIAAAGMFAAAGGIGAGLLKIGSTFDDAFDTIRVGTGATGEALEGLQESVKNIGRNVPASFGDIGTAVADLNTRLGLSGIPLEQMSAQILNLSRITGTDLNTNIESISRAMGDWGFSTEEMSPKLDALYRASQATGPSVEKLSQLMTTFGGPMRQLGFSFEETAAMLGKFEKEGVNTELVMGSMRIALGKMAKAGVEDVPAALRKTIDEIKNAGSAGEANSKALELFGAKAGPDMAAAIREGRFDIASLVDQIANGTDTIGAASADTADFAESWQLFKNRVSIALEPLASKVFGAVGSSMEKIGPIIEGVVGKVLPLISKFGDTVTTGFSAFGAAFREGDVTSDGFVGVMERIGNVARDVFNTIKSINWADVFSRAKEVITPVVSSLVELAGAVADFAIKYWPTVQAAIQTAAPIIKDVLVTTLGAATTVIKFLSNNMAVAGPAILTVAAGFAALKAIQGVNSMITNTVTGVKMFVTNAQTALVTARNYGAAVLNAGRAALTFAANLAVTTGRLIAQGAAFLAQKVAALASAAASGVMTAAQWLLNAAMAANPITLIVIAIAALVAGLVLLYMKCEPVREIINAIGHAIMSGLKAAIDWITNDAVPAVLRFASAVWDGIQKAIDFFIALPGRIWDALGNLGNWLFDKGRDLIWGLIKGYLAIWGDIISFFTQLPGKILSFIGHVGDLLTSAGSAIIDSLQRGLSNAWSNVTGWVGRIGGWIKDSVGNLGDLLWGVGSDIVSGLRNGLSSAWHRVTDFIRGAVEKIPGPIRSILGIGSPSKVFADIGRDTVAGLVVGLHDGQAGLAKAVQGVASTMLGTPMTLAPLRGPAGTASYARPTSTMATTGTMLPRGDLNLTINQSGLTDPMSAADEISFKLKTLGR